MTMANMAQITVSDEAANGEAEQRSEEVREARERLEKALGRPDQKNLSTCRAAVRCGMSGRNISEIWLWP
jgi:hypothetical protein